MSWKINCRIHARGGRSLCGGARGFSFVELMVAVAIGAGVSVGLGAMLIISGRMQKSVMFQQMALTQAMKGIEGLNREIRMATSPLLVTNSGGDAVIQGNRVVFRRTNEPDGRRAIALISTDNDPMTPSDNRLVLDPNTAQSGDEVTLARNLAPLDAQGAFIYEGAAKALQVRLRIGDPPSVSAPKSDGFTGPGKQGVEIIIDVAPRNDSTN